MPVLAISPPLRMASETSPPLPRPTPTRPRLSPTTTKALKLNRRPPLTTLAERLMNTTFSDNCSPPWPSRPDSESEGGRPRRGPRPRPPNRPPPPPPLWPPPPIGPPPALAAARPPAPASPALPPLSLGISATVVFLLVRLEFQARL